MLASLAIHRDQAAQYHVLGPSVDRFNSYPQLGLSRGNEISYLQAGKKNTDQEYLRTGRSDNVCVCDEVTGGRGWRKLRKKSITLYKMTSF